ncbi:Ldh family oxidoreductase [Isoptericola sp. NPDC019693]|uniref:Ldh family oxidoreductase n=1 Tax=Isoptericola sp. NPDC019693 TaxID=3364009 RepID=UPI0037AA0A8E
MNRDELPFSPSSTATASDRLLERGELVDLCERAVRGAGGSSDTARALAEAMVSAELRGKPSVGVSHLLDFVRAIPAGRLNGDPRPTVERRRLSVVVADADRGAAQVAFARALPVVLDGVRDAGVAVLSIRNCYPAGELAHYAITGARAGFVALAATNSPALLAAYGSRAPITGTNPLAFALPHPDGPRAFDQAASATAWVSVREAAERGEAIPDGWALGPDGDPTDDASAALAGALLPSGGVKGANIAVMVEMLAALSGGAFSVDAAPFERGSTSPAVGLFLLLLDPAAFDPGFVDRAEAHHRRLTTEHGADFGRRKAEPAAVRLPSAVLDELEEWAR